jgi:putative FmdB family regulatory protein
MSALTPQCGANVDSVPIYEFQCAACGTRFEELVRAGESAPCPQCKSLKVERRYSQISEGRVPVGLFGKAAAESNARRREREEKRREGFSRPDG